LMRMGLENSYAYCLQLQKERWIIYYYANWVRKEELERWV